MAILYEDYIKDKEKYDIYTPPKKKAKQKNNGYFKKSKGNTGQAIGYSALDALGNFTEGSLNFFEGMSDSARYAGANVLDFFGADKKAEEIRERARENDVEDIVNQWNHITAGDLSGTKSEKEIGRFKKVEDNSVFGEKSDQVIQGVGNSLTGAAVGSYLGAPITGVGKGANLARNVIGLTSFGSSAAGHATTEAYNEGANDFQAGVYGILSGAVESGSEMLFGGLGKINKSLGFGTGALDDVIVKKLTKNIGNTLFRNIATIGLKSAGEGAEEIASLLGDQLVRRMMNMDSKTLKELAEDGTLADTFVQGTLSSLISQTPSGISSTVQGRDYTTGLTRTQQQYVNEIAQQRMVEAQKRNARLNGMQKSQIEDRALTDYQRGRLADANKLQQVNLPGLSTKDMDLQQSAYKYGFNPNSEAIVTAKTMLDNRGIKSRFDADAFKNIEGNAYWTNNNGVREVIFNPNASEQTILEEIAIHELTHDLMSSKNSRSLLDKQNIIDYVSTLKGYKESRAKLEDLYSKQTKGMNKQKATDLINEEIVADTLGKNIGSQEYIRRLIDDEPSIAKNIYDWVVNKVANKSGVKNEKAYWNNVKNNFEKAYNMEYQGKGSKKSNNQAKYKIVNDKKYGRHWVVETEKDIFKGKTKKELQKSAFDYILNGNTNFETITDTMDGKKVKFIRISAKEYTRGRNSQNLNPNEYQQKMRLAPSVDDLINNAEIQYHSPLTHKNNMFKDGFNNYQGKVKIDDTYFRYIVRVGKAKNDNIFYDISLENLDTKKEANAVPGAKSTSPLKNLASRETNVTQSNDNVKSDQKYSLSDNKGYHYGDLGKARDTNFFSMRSSRRSTGHFGHGTYFLGNKENVGSSSKGSRTLQEVDFSDYNLFKPLIENQAWRLHDGLKAINNEDYSNFDIELMKDVFKSYGISQESIDKAIEKTMDYSIKLDSKNYEEQLEADSPSTVFMKALGYEGIDVRGLDGLDNTSYGSVIYDLKKNNSMSKQLENQATNLVEEDIQTTNAMLDNFKSYLEEYDITNPTQEDIDNSLIDLLGYDNDMTPAETLKYEKQYKEVVNEYLNGNNDIRYSLSDYQDYTNEINATLEKAKNLDEKFYNDLIAQQEEYRERHQLEYNILEETNSRPATNENINSDFFKEHRSEYDEKRGTKTADGILTVMHLQKGDNLAKLSFTEGEDKIWIDELYVKNQKQGYGSEIVNAIKKYAEENGKYVEAFKELSTAKGFWDKTLRNNDIRYSLSDNQGRELSEGQQEYFKDSKVRDSEGNLKVMYHGTEAMAGLPEDVWFTVFDTKRAGRNGSFFGTGFYFTDSKEHAQDYAHSKGKVYETYLNIKKPYIPYQNLEDGISRTFKEDLAIRLNVNKEASSLTGEEITNILKENGYDGVINGDTVVAFYPEQIKNVDNTNPTDNADIRYSQQNENWQSFLDNNFEAKGTKTRLSDIKLPGVTKAVQEEVQKQTSNALLPIANELKELNKNLTKVMNPTEISQLTPQDANTTPILPGVNRNKVGDGKSKFFDNIKNKTNMLNDEQKTAILNSEDVKYYDKVTNKDSLDKAFERLQNGGATETLRWHKLANRDENGQPIHSISATDIAEGWILLKQYADNGDTENMVEVAKTLRNMGTMAGQTVQAFNIMSRLTPEGMVKYAQSELLEAYDKMVKNKSREWIEQHREDFDLQPNEVQFIMDTMQEVSQMEDGYDKRVKLAEIQKLMTDKLPPTKGAGLKAWMRISMLFNPKTQIRNIAGNAVIAPVNYFGDLFASGVDKLISQKTGVRTTGTTKLSNYAKGFKTGLYQSYNDFKKGINTRNIEGNRFEVTEGKSFNDNNPIGKALNRVDSLLSFMLDAGDRGFYEASFVNSINNQMVLNNTTEVTQEMIDIATQEALSRTWQDNNTYSKAVLGIRKLLNLGQTYGIGDVLIPFAKTPANLTKAIVDYSPAGLVNVLVKGNNLRKSLNNGQFNAKMQHEFVQSLGKATAGTMLYILGYALAQAGITSGASDEDKDVSNFMKNTLGISSYSIKIGDKSFTYDWAQPIAAPLTITANVVNAQKEDKEQALTEAIIGSLDSAGSTLLEQSFLQSINDVLNNQDGVISGLITEMLELPARAIPTLSKQIVDLTDSTQRQTFEYNKPIKSAYNYAISKIPGLSYTLDPSVDTMGREIKKYGGKNNLFNVFLNPANVSTENVSESAQEIYRLYKETGETNIMPRVAPYYVNKKGKKIILTTQQRTEYQKISGAIIEENIANLLGSTSYQNMTDTNKAEVINDIVNYSYNIAQNQVLGLELADTYKTAYEYAQIGNISDFYKFRNSIDDTDSTTKRTSIKNYLVNSDLDDNQIANLYGNYYSSDKTLNAMLELRIPIKEFIKFDVADIQGKYNSKTGKTINGSKKNATIEFVNTLNLSKAQKAILIKDAYNTYDRYNNDIIRYVNTLNGSVDEKKVWLKSIGFDNYDRDVVRYIKSQGLSQEETEKKLKDLGFTIRDGRVYY